MMLWVSHPLNLSYNNLNTNTCYIFTTKQQIVAFMNKPNSSS